LVGDKEEREIMMMTTTTGQKEKRRRRIKVCVFLSLSLLQIFKLQKLLVLQSPASLEEA
jgi:hypothetical protein